MAADAVQTRAQLYALMADNSIGAITPQVLREAVESSIVYIGPYDNTVTYNYGDLASTSAGLYEAIQTTVGNATTNTTYWTPLFLTPSAFPGSFPYVTPTSGATVTLVANAITIIDPATALLALTIAFPANPIDGMQTGLTTTQVITAVTWTAGTLAVGLSLAATGSATFVYVAAKTKWYRKS